MKKIISGKVYDTDTAALVGEWQAWQNGCPKNDFRYYEEHLYRKKTGEFFLYGNGNAASPYAESCGLSERAPGERIVPLTYEQAQKWAEEKLEVEEYEAIFGIIEDDGSRQSLNLSLTTSVVETVKRRAAEAGVTVSAYIENLINNS